MRVNYPPNQPILIANTEITSIDGNHTRLPVRIVQHLWPRQQFLIKSQDLPKNLIDHPSCRITIGSSNAPIDAHLAVYALAKLMNTGNLSGSLVPNEYPRLAVLPNTLLQSAELAIVNFTKFLGSTDQYEDRDGYSHKLGAAKIKEGPWLIELKSVQQLDKVIETLEAEGGRSITHEVKISRIDKGVFSAVDLFELIKSLRAFMSFVRGANCGISSVYGTDQKGLQLPVRWGMENVAPWSIDRSLLLTVGGGDDIPIVFSGFYRPLSSHAWKENVFNAIDWYVHSNEVPFHVGIVLSQTSLEVLSRLIIGSRWGKLPNAASHIGEALRISGVPQQVPASFGDLDGFCRKNGMASGPETLVRLRNYLAHGNLKSRQVPSRVFLEGHELCQWYIEMLLLHVFGYNGRYHSRISGLNKSSICNVPWAGSQGTP